MVESAASDHEGKELILFGDFNCDIGGRRLMQAGLADLAMELNMSHLIAKPTRMTENSRTTVLYECKVNLLKVAYLSQ